MRTVDLPSPNHGERRAGANVDVLVLHYTGMRSAGDALRRLRDPAAEVSAHYLIDEDGAVWRLVPEERRAWHAGVGTWRGEGDVNSRSIGIELVNPGHAFGYRPFPEAQMAALEQLTRGLLGRHAIAPADVVGHSDVACGRKEDPGELFDWSRLARAGIGLWPESGEPAAADTEDAIDVAALQRLLARYGYGIAATRVLDGPSRTVLDAFHRHFHPARLGGEPDGETLRRLASLVQQAGR